MRRLLALVPLLVIGSIGYAQATTITFDDLPAQAPGTDTVVFAPTPIFSGGFRVDAANHAHIDNGAWGTTNGTNDLVVDDFLGPDPVTFSPSGGGPFGLDAIDLSEAHPLSCCYATQVTVTGNLFGGGTVSTTLTLPTKGTPTADYFQTFTFGPEWDDLSSFVLHGLGGGGYYAIDNVVVSAAPAPVPEPGTLTLLGLGAAYLARRRRRS
jgi:hypothetical protein